MVLLLAAVFFAIVPTVAGAEDTVHSQSTTRASLNPAASPATLRATCIGRLTTQETVASPTASGSTARSRAP